MCVLDVAAHAMQFPDEMRVIKIAPAALEELRGRLRRPPVPSSVTGSLPILFFGDAPAARLLTVGLNPSDQEYVDTQGTELNGERRRFHTLASLEASARGELTEMQCDRAIEMMRGYFTPGQPVFRWFRPLSRVVEAMGASFVGRSAAHLDLVQESTTPVWSSLSKEDQAVLLAADRAFLRWQLSDLQARVVACNGATVLRAVIDLTDAVVVNAGALQRLRWTVARARPGTGRVVAVVGWNIPLTRPTGLGAEGERELGRLLVAELDAACGAEWRA
jgi:hypothetical protein